jgi:hypothetical protein
MGQGDVEAAALNGLQACQHRRQLARGGAEGQVHPVKSQLLQGGVVHGRRQAVPHRIAQHRHQTAGPTDAGPAPAALLSFLSQGAIPRLNDGESAGVRRSGRGLVHGNAGGWGESRPAANPCPPRVWRDSTHHFGSGTTPRRGRGGLLKMHSSLIHLTQEQRTHG